MTQIACSLFIRDKCSTDINKKKMTQIKGTLGKLANKAKLASNQLKRVFTGEAVAEKQLNRLAKQRILQQKSSWRPTQKMREANLEGKKQSIRDARAMRSAASKAELKQMQENPDKATKVYKSGTREFGGDENKSALLRVRQEAMKPYLDKLTHSVKWQAKRLIRSPFYNSETGKISKKKLGTLGLVGLATAGYNFEPVNFYVHDLYKGVRNKIGLDSKSTTRTEKDMSDDFNNQIQELAALAIASGQNGLTPRVYQVYNRSHGREAKYADFSNPLKFFNPGQRVEYSDGGMSMSQSRNKNGYDVILTDEAAWDPDEGVSYSPLSPRGLPVMLGVTKKNLGDNTDKMRYQYNIPSEKVDSMRNVYNKYSEIIRKERGK